MERRRSIFENIFKDPNLEENTNPVSSTSQNSISKNYLEVLANYNSIQPSRSSSSRNSLAAIWSCDDSAAVSASSNVTVDVDPYFEPHDFGNTDKPTSFWGTVFHLIFVSINGCLLFIPSLFVKVGFVAGFVLTFVIVYFYAYNVHMIVWTEYEICKVKRVPKLTYPEVVYQAFRIGPMSIHWLAPHIRWFIYTVFVLIWGCACIYVYVVASQNIKFTYEYVFGNEIEIRQILVAAFIPLMLVGLIRRLSYLVFLTILGFAFHYLSVLIVIYFVATDPTPWQIGNIVGSVSDIPLFFGTILVSVNITGIILPLKNEMKIPKRFNSTFGALTITYAFISVVISSFSIACSLKYGSNINTIVTQNLPQEQLLAQIANLLYVLSLFCLYPLLLYVSVDVIWNNIMKESKVRDNMVYNYAIRIGLGVIIFGMAYAIPEVSFYISISGTIGTSLDSIIFPAVVQTLVAHRMDEYKGKFKILLIKNTIIVCLGSILLIAGIRDCINMICPS